MNLINKYFPIYYKLNILHFGLSALLMVIDFDKLFRILYIVILLISLFLLNKISKTIFIQEKETPFKIRKYLTYNLGLAVFFPFLLIFFATSNLMLLSILVKHFVFYSIEFFVFIYFLKSSEVRNFYGEGEKDFSGSKLIYLIRSLFVLKIIVFSIIFLVELSWFLEKEKYLNPLISIFYIYIHILIFKAIRSQSDSTPNLIQYYLGLAFTAYFLHHSFEYLFYSDSPTFWNYNSILSIISLIWTGFWFYVFRYSNRLRRLYIV